MDALDFMVDRDQHMRPLEYDLSENFNALLRYMQDMGILDNVPVGTTSESEIVSISDAYPAPPRALTVYGKSTQAGTPTPDAPVPILSVDDLALVTCGKNLIDFNFGNAASYTTNGPYSYRYSDPIKLVPNTTFTWAQTGAGTTAGYLSVKVFSGSGVAPTSPGTNKALLLNGSWQPPITFTTGPSGYIRFTYLTTEVDLTEVAKGNFQLELGSTATAYEPYQGTTVPDLLPEGTSLRSLPDGTRDTLSLSYLRPSTRAGWAWYSRELVQNTSTLDDIASLTWSLVTYGTSKYQATLAGCRNGATNQSIEVMCSTLAGAATRAATADITGEPNTIRMRQGYGILMVPPDTDVTILSGTLLYPLATPVTTTLDPIELPTLPAPNATIWCDGGSATPTLILEYVKDASAAIAELSEAIADIVSG